MYPLGLHTHCPRILQANPKERNRNGRCSKFEHEQKMMALVRERLKNTYQPKFLTKENLQFALSALTYAYWSTHQFFIILISV